MTDYNRILNKKGVILFLYTDFSGKVELAEEICVSFHKRHRGTHRGTVEWYSFDELKENWNGEEYILNKSEQDDDIDENDEPE